MNAKEAAELIGRSETTILAWIHSGKLAAMKFGRSWHIEERDLLGMSQVKGKVTAEDRVVRRLEKLEEAVASCRRKSSRIEDYAELMVTHLAGIAEKVEYIRQRLGPRTQHSDAISFAREHGIDPQWVEDAMEHVGTDAFFGKLGGKMVRMVSAKDHDAVIAWINTEGQTTKPCLRCETSRSGTSD